MTTIAREAEPLAKLFLVARDEEMESQSLLDRLARLYRLYSYGGSGVTTLVRAEMERAAMALTGVFLFDFAAWTLIWNAVFHRGEFVVDRVTLLAVALGVLFAVIVVSFEQGVLTTDWSVPGARARAKRWMTLLLRLAVVGASALATSQVIDVMIFASDIADRVHQERVWEEIASRALEFQRLQDAAQGKGDAAIYWNERDKKQEVLQGTMREQGQLNQRLTSTRQTAASVRSNLPTLQQRVNETQRQARQARAALDEVARVHGVRTAAEQRGHPDVGPAYRDWEQSAQQAAAARSALNGATSRLQALDQQIGSLTDQVAGIQPLIAAQTEDRDNSRQNWDKFQTATTERRDVLQRWITRVANSAADDKVITEDAYSYRERPYSFAEQLRVLDDLLNARPAQRHNLLSIRPETLNQVLNMDDPRRQDDAFKEDRKNRAAVLRRLYRGLFVLAIFVPCMGVLFKLTMHPQLTAYYSAERQARSGNLEAMQHL